MNGRSQPRRENAARSGRAKIVLLSAADRTSGSRLPERRSADAESAELSRFAREANV
jgi:hypothetical protein